jgi:transposase
MAAGKGILVDIPDDKGVHVKSAGAKGEKYVYCHTKYYRNADGNPRNKSVSIGKYDAESGRMVPNANYYERFQVDPVPADSTRWDYGFCYLVLKLSREIGLCECLQTAFGKSGAMDILVMAAYIIREGGAMDGIDDWQSRNYFPEHSRQMSSQVTSRCFASYGYAQRMKFFARRIKTAMTGDTVCYDVTSISSYSKNMISVERGYNRDGDDLAQYNLGMFCDEKSRTPLYFNRYSGSLTDRTNLSKVLANAKEVGIRRVKLVIDGGFWMEECLKSLAKECAAFTVGLPASQDISKEMIAAHGAGIASYANQIGSQRVFCVQAECALYGVPGKILLYYDEWNHANLCRELSEKIDRLTAELKALKRYPKSKLGRFKNYFAITKHETDGGFDFVAKTDEIDAESKCKGFFLLFTNDMDASPSDALYYYRAKDADEKIFAQIKVDMAGARIRTHSEETTEGKTFVTFVACVIRSYMLRNLRQYLTDNSVSLKKALNQLSNIEIVSGSDGFRFIKALTKKQKQILSAFNAEKDIIDSVENLSTLIS